MSVLDMMLWVSNIGGIMVASGVIMAEIIIPVLRRLHEIKSRVR